jgi:hypothetical protein
VRPDKDLQEAAAKTYESEGYKVIRATIGGTRLKHPLLPDGWVVLQK